MSAKTFSITIKNDPWCTISQKDAILQETDLSTHNVQYLSYQEEEDDGKGHLQGMIQFTKRQSVRQVLQFFNVLGISEVHVEKVRNINTLYDYIHKSMTRVPGGASLEIGDFTPSGGCRHKGHKSSVNYEDVWAYFQNGGHPNLIVKTLGPNALKVPYKNIYSAYLDQKRQETTMERIAEAEGWWFAHAWKWQKEARKILEKWSEDEESRKIMVIYDPSGDNGKSEFCKKFQDLNPEENAYIKKSKCDNMSFLLKDFDNLKYCLIDYTRDDEKHGSPKFLECLKDGIVQSNKYQPTSIRFPNVQVAVMTNKELDWSTLTKDRWAVYEIFGIKDKAEFTEWGKSMKRDKI